MWLRYTAPAVKLRFQTVTLGGVNIQISIEGVCVHGSVARQSTDLRTSCLTPVQQELLSPATDESSIHTMTLVMVIVKVMVHEFVTNLVDYCDSVLHDDVFPSCTHKIPTTQSTSTHNTIQSKLRCSLSFPHFPPNAFLTVSLQAARRQSGGLMFTSGLCSVFGTQTLLSQTAEQHPVKSI